MEASLTPLVLRLVSASVSIAKRAGKLIKDIRSKGDLGIVDKGIYDLQTEGDRSAQRCIISSLAQQFLGVEVIGEEELSPNEEPLWIDEGQTEEVLKSTCPENLQSVQDQDVVVWVDPLDGTNEFTEGLLDHVTVLIGIAVNGKAVGGVIHQPYYNYQAGHDAVLERTMWGIVGIGAYGIDRKLPPADKRIITTLRSQLPKSATDSIEACEPTEVLRAGGAGNKALNLIDGLAHSYMDASTSCSKWDTCAPEAILKSIGGNLTDIHGNLIPYNADVKLKNHTGVLATCNGDHSWYVNRIPQSVRDELKA